MHTIKRSPALLLGALLTLTLLTGCLGSSPTLRYYVLESVDTPITDSTQDQPLAVDITAVHLPRYLERPQIVVRDTDNQISFSESNQWGGNLRKDMIRTLANNLSRQLPSPDVATPLLRASRLPQYRVEVEILNFERAPDNHVRLSARWQISGGDDGQAAVKRISDLQGKSTIEQDDYDQLVRDMSVLYGRLSEIIADEIRRQARQMAEQAEKDKP